MPMIEPESALRLILEKADRLPAEKRRLETVYGSVLAEEIVAEHDMPPFDNSAMDGYAVLASDITSAAPDNPVALKLVEEQPAGKATDVAVSPGTAIKIMTGAPVPAGADTVVQVEKTTEEPGGVRTAAALRRGSNVRLAGEELTAGSTALTAGTVVDHVIIGVLASLGYAKTSVYREPVVAIIGTGNELVPVEEPLRPGKIRDSNSYALTAQAAATGVPAKRMGVAGDTREEVTQLVKTALETADIVVTSGGVSVGDYDYVKDVIEDLGGKLHFWGVKQEPGKPLAFWTIGDKLVFGLPGNPSASLISFEEYVRPAILKMTGRTKLFRPVVQAKLTHDFKKKPGRHQFVGALVTKVNGEYEWAVNGRQGSGMLRSITGANGIAVIPADATELSAGDRVEVQMINRPEDH